jgi:hypothetical protein
MGIEYPKKGSEVGFVGRVKDGVEVIFSPYRPSPITHRRACRCSSP